LHRRAMEGEDDNDNRAAMKWAMWGQPPWAGPFKLNLTAVSALEITACAISLLRCDMI
jgi:hypothetical protein